MLLLTGTMTACVQDDDSSQQHVLSAAQVCDDVLSPTGRKALELVSGTERFTELTRRNEAGDPERFSVALAAEKLRGNLVIAQTAPSTGPMTRADILK
ncbi:hypothetical protein [Streptomyces sp. SID8016]|uniref:hypothetical protein n=1 Tax=Streptomyces sp. SID8016 TaxID=2706098 RepID=UPI0013DB8DDB|nr:hypothetical protein [Streptomyces sp. SID8016]